MSTRLKILAIILSFPLFHALFAVQLTQASSTLIDYENIHFEKIETGFMLNSILQDRDGFFWLGTQSGLVKYNGYDFEVFQAGPDSIPGNWVNVLYEDSEGLIWFGTTSGLGVYDKSTDTFTQFKNVPLDPTSISNDIFSVFKLQSISEDKTGAIWLGTQDGLNKYDKESRTFTRFKARPGDTSSLLDNDIWAILPGSDGMLWISTSKGLHKFDPVLGIVIKRYESDNTDPDAIHGHQIVALMEDGEGILWAGTNDAGLNRFEIKSSTFSHYMHDPDDPTSLSNSRLSAIITLKNEPDTLWITTAGGGLNLFDKTTGKAIHFQYDDKHPDSGSIGGNNLWGILQDQVGAVWIADLGGILNVFDKGAQNFTNYVHNPEDSNSLSKNQYVGRVIEDRQGTIWISASSGGLDRYERKTGKFTHFHHIPADPYSLPETFCQSVFEDTEGRLWVTTENWIVLFDKHKGQIIKKYQAKVYLSVPLEDRNNPDVIWWGTWGTGLIKFNKNTGSVEYITTDPVRPDETISSNTAFPFFQDDEGFLWVATAGSGVDIFDPVSKKVVNKFKHNEDDPTSLSSNTVWHIYRDSSRRLWISTERGLNLFKAEDGTFVHYNKQNGLFPLNTVAQILEDTQGKLWVSGYTTGELVRFDPDDGSYKLFSKADGIHSGIGHLFRVLKTRDGKLWFPGSGGITSFDSEKITDNPNLPPVYLTSLKQGGEEINLNGAPEKTQEIYLDWRQNFFEFEAAALNYRNTGSNQYKYILEGFDKDWYESGTTRKGRYSGLPGGEYTLRIKGSNNDGVWSDREVALKIIVNNPFWKTGWFIAAVAALGLITLLLVVFYIRKMQAEVTDRKHAEEELREREERLRAIFESADNVSFIITDATDPDPLVIEFSPGAERIFGYTGSEIIGNPVSILHLPADVAKFPEVHAQMRKGHVGFSGESTLIRKSGEKFPALFSSFPLSDERGTVYGTLGVSIDISEQKRLEDQLQKAQKMEAMGLMAGGIAHDLNNILSGIVSYPELLLMDLPEDSPLRKPIKTIQESGMRAADVVEDLLTIARGIATGKEVLNLNTLVEEYLDSAEHQKLEKIHPLITFKADLDSELLNITCSASHVKKVLMNLIVNASEAIEGGGTVVISTMNRYLDEPLKGYEDVRIGEYVMLTVSDNGSGISPQDLDRIFEPFYTKKVMGRSGTGLGLAVVWNSIQDHNGYINVKSSEKGTAFELYFPVTREEVAEEREQALLEDYIGHGEKILVVDDEETQREIAAGILTRLGYNAETVSSGEEAIEYVKENPVDLIVLDMVMPKGINGRKTYGKIIKIRPGQKAIIASGYAKTREVDLAQELGAGRYIKKPYTMPKVGLAVKEELEK